MDYWFLIILQHLLINGPLMIYIGYIKPKHIFYYYLLFIIGLVFAIHLLFKYLGEQKLSAWLYVHLLIHIPLFMYVGYLGINNMKIAWYYYEFILALGIAAMGYFSVKLYKYYNK